MKRYNNLYSKIYNFENLLLAAKKAERGKRYEKSTLKFNYNLEREILELKRLLETETYQPGEYKVFFVQESKKRMISAAPYRDRVVHHALCNIISPLLEKSLIDNCYANRIGLGTHKAVRRFTQFARNSKYVLQCDIRKYFPSIDHEILKELIAKKIKCKRTLDLINKIIDGSNEQEQVTNYFAGDDLLTINRRKGLPIGNLTSQFFANMYLNEFDHFILEKLKISKYLRYVVDTLTVNLSTDITGDS